MSDKRISETSQALFPAPPLPLAAIAWAVEVRVIEPVVWVDVSPLGSAIGGGRGPPPSLAGPCFDVSAAIDVIQDPVQGGSSSLDVTTPNLVTNVTPRLVRIAVAVSEVVPVGAYSSNNQLTIHLK